ncbi:kinase-like domain-containing protein, partial [Amanita rubescens]
VAEGVRYIHSEGIVHGDLRGENIFLDAKNNCQIVADVGLAQHSNAIVTLSAAAFFSNYAAPELFVMQFENNERHEDHEVPHGSKTVQTDVYSFGCLYYAIFFDTIPFVDRNKHQIMRLVTAGERPERLTSPRMGDGLWNLIHRCWSANPLDRPSMTNITNELPKFTPLLSLLAILKKVYLPRC